MRIQRRDSEESTNNDNGHLEIKRDESSLTPLKLSEDLNLRIEDITGKCIAVLGIRGSGKTNTAAVITEELLSAGFPVAVIDIDGEYWGLKEKYEIIHIGKGNVDVEISPNQGAPVAKFSIERGVPVILDLSGYLRSEITELLVDFFGTMWNLSLKIRRPYFIVLEEAHEFVPQGQSFQLKEYLERIALRGRKRGLGIILVSQRSAKVDKNILTQAEIFFLHRVLHPADLRIYQEILPIDRKKLREVIPKLGIGECVFYNGREMKIIKIRERETFHAGSTPLFEPSQSIPLTLKNLSEELIQEINRLISNTSELDETERIKRENMRLREEIREKEREIQLLKRRLATVESHTADSRPNTGIGATDDRYLEARDRLTKILSKMRRPTIEILRVLVGFSGDEFDYYTLAAVTGYHVDTLRKCSKELNRLVKMGIIDKSRRGKRLVYSFRIGTESSALDFMKEVLRDILMGGKSSPSLTDAVEVRR